ncbi:LysR family transcriptional regulator [Bordetella sp. BOR01]|uniref:LysR family transcriptional regulator n=1 Tax=Bordetella sp. BOR01 TaxID=2854779 RepID=UPI001C452B79|nr:LysR family transcriptional regulator [Bordetella sp. BOR01]MBV7482292.1 LysR family transcriptional regulator [Bordetella sp. BOR01]
MSAFTLHDLQCFDAVVRTGGFQAAATALHRSHPAVFAAVAKLERQLGLALLDRGGYRVCLTDAGRSFHRKAQALLHELEGLQAHAAQLAMGEESELRVVIGDLCPRPATLALLSRFFANCPVTRLDLHYEAVTGPWERLFDDQADLILHRIDKSDPRIEWVDLCKVAFVPVVAPGFLPFAPSRSLAPNQLRDFTQCIIRDTARHTDAESYFVIEDAHQCTVPDQLMKKEIILQGMAWGHLPRFLIERELAKGHLLAITGRHLPGRTEELVAARRRDRPHGPAANRLWEFLQTQAAGFRAAADAPPSKRAIARKPARGAR